MDPHLHGRSNRLTIAGFLIFPSLSVFIAHLLRLLVVEKGQKGITTISCHRCYLVQKRAGEYDRGAWLCLEGLIAKFGEAKIAAYIVIIQIDRYCKEAMSDNWRRVVAGRTKIASRLRVITTYQISLDARRAKLKGTIDHGQ